ncbi:MAG: NAD-dependent epimerase/dehydratase family protein, partial [Butyricicoccaceae bacterium]
MKGCTLESPDNLILQKDLEMLAADASVPFAAFHNKTVLVTGATGLIGSQIVKALVCSNRYNNTNIRILALVRSQEKAYQVLGGLCENRSVELVQGDVMQLPEIAEPIDYMIHGASPTSSRYFVSNPVETILTAVNGTRNLLELAREKQIQGFLYLSSLEVYGTPDPNAGL